MGFLIDTSLWIAIERGRIGAADIHAITGQEPIFVSPVNLAEIRFGIELMSDAKQRHRAMAMLRRMRRKPLLRITGETAEIFGVSTNGSFFTSMSLNRIFNSSPPWSCSAK